MLTRFCGVSPKSCSTIESVSGKINVETDEYESPPDTHTQGTRPSTFVIGDTVFNEGLMGLRFREALDFVFGLGYFTFAQFVFLLHQETIALSENHDYGNWTHKLSEWKFGESNCKVTHLFHEQLGISFHLQSLGCDHQRPVLRCTTYRHLRSDHDYKGRTKMARTRLRVTGHPRWHYQSDG